MTKRSSDLGINLSKNKIYSKVKGEKEHLSFCHKLYVNVDTAQTSEFLMCLSFHCDLSHLISLLG